MIRLFVALALPDALCRRLAALQQPLPRSRWATPENMHVTLRFVGEVPRGEADDIGDMLSRIAVPAFDITVSGTGRFGSKARVRALWAGIAKSPELMRLQGKVETACQRAGQPPEGRKFHPHVTLARCRDIREDQARDFLCANDGFFGGTVRVGEFVLYSSRLGHDGPVYTPEARYPLSGDGRDVVPDDARFAALAEEWAND
jgi:2'-5' RNA ligase